MIFPQFKITQSSFLLGVHESQVLDQVLHEIKASIVVRLSPGHEIAVCPFISNFWPYILSNRFNSDER